MDMRLVEGAVIDLFRKDLKLQPWEKFGIAAMYVRNDALLKKHTSIIESVPLESLLRLRNAELLTMEIANEWYSLECDKQLEYARLSSHHINRLDRKFEKDFEIDPNRNYLVYYTPDFLRELFSRNGIADLSFPEFCSVTIYCEKKGIVFSNDATKHVNEWMKLTPAEKREIIVPIINTERFVEV